jgi:hypothetical protein
LSVAAEVAGSVSRAPLRRWVDVAIATGGVTADGEALARAIKSRRYRNLLAKLTKDMALSLTLSLAPFSSCIHELG